MDLERRFAADVATGGGKAFATWFAEDAVSLSNGRPALLGRGAVVNSANWDPRPTQLTWTPTAARMGPSNDMGFTWGHYEGHSRDAHGEPVIVTGRYIRYGRNWPTGPGRSPWTPAPPNRPQPPTAARYRNRKISEQSSKAPPEISEPTPINCEIYRRAFSGAIGF